MRGTSTSASPEASQARAVDARVARVGGEPVLVVSLRDGRLLGLPLWLYPTLHGATPASRKRWELIAGGRGIRWPELDLDLSVNGMLAGTPDLTRNARKVAKAMDLRAYARALSHRRTIRRAG